MWDLVAELSSSGPASWEPGESAGPRRGSQQVGEVFTRQVSYPFGSDGHTQSVTRAQRAAQQVTAMWSAINASFHLLRSDGMS